MACISLRTVVVSAALGIATIIHPSAVTAEVMLQFNRWLPPKHFVQAEVLEPWLSEIGKVTAGRVKVQSTASSLGPPQRQFDLAKDGVADIVWGVHGYTPERFRTSAGLELPFLGNSAESLSIAYWRTYQKHFAKLNEYAGTKVLALHVHPPGDIFSSRELKQLGDIAGQKLRTPNPASALIAGKLGAVPIAAPAPKAYELLSRGVIDGTFLPSESVVNFKLQKFIKHHMEIDGGIYNTSFFVVMNERKWNALTKEDQEAIQKISGESFAKRLGSVWDNQQSQANALLDKGGIVRTKVEGEMLDQMKRTIGNPAADWVKSMNARGVDGEAALQMIKDEAAAYTGSK